MEVDPNTWFINIERIKKAQEEAAALEARKQLQEPEIEAKKAAAAALAAGRGVALDRGVEKGRGGELRYSGYLEQSCSSTRYGSSVVKTRRNVSVCSGARLGGVALTTAPPTRDRLAVGAFPSLDKDKELEGLEQEPSSNHIMDSSSHEPGEMPAPESIREFTAASEGTSSPQSQMPTPNMSGMITMSVADLLAFYQQMTCQNTPNINNDTPADDFKSQIYEYQKDVQRAMNTKTIDVKYAVYLIKEHLNVMKELTILHVNNDYLIFQRRFHYLVAYHKKLMNDSEDFYHDLFFIDLKEHQKSFVKMCLNDFYTTGQDLIKNIDINDLMKQLMNCMSKFNEYLKSS
ncbi:hypothetical protein PAAG_06976 [Paracoccidioides lutzii Pb01]|uniref:Uncharacterized protein n=1 Tax=Paracoccidioides lutzii (strain ATCC MYA-826 / Pb01) TaxID=502779 RepID=C1H8I0_PARBA|nr:hypothetical protein PAAG_06976 [Paracoccidioides lutzii Pb01]EEH36558.2 hypothetical protein PAAG_06976 [Paracoccidioides lutzii Pb01]